MKRFSLLAISAFSFLPLHAAIVEKTVLYGQGGVKLEAFGKEMAAAGADWRLVMYGGAVHAFTQKMAGDDISKGVAYDARAEERSWRDMKGFFTEIFGEP